MGKKDKDSAQSKKEKISKASVEAEYRRWINRGRHTSIYFLLWTIFSVFSLLIVVLFGSTQQIMMTQSYKNEASREVSERGKKIEAQISQGLPEGFGDNFSGYLRMLATENEVRIYILNEEGRVLFPQEPNIDFSDPEIQDYYDFSDEIKTMLAELGSEGRAVYEDGNAYVYGSRIALIGNTPVYLYVAKSLSLVKTTVVRMNVHVLLVAVFAFVLSFAVSSAVSGWLVKPLSEMTKKAHLLAQGNFDVDFHGNDYGQEVTELAETLNFARDELSKTDRMQKELIANVSHDFKTPLTMIKAYASMIIEISGEIPEKRNKHAQVIVDEADRLASLVNDVLDLSKIRSGIEELKAETLDMSACVYEILDRFAYLKDTQGYVFEIDVDEGLYTRADELKIQQVLYNLIGNAVNYTGEDKTVYVSLKKEEGECFRFAVRDTGAGIKPEELGDIWDRYYRARENHKRPVQGTGLGLSIVKTVLQKHKLQFGVDSEVDKGSTFYVIFPLDKSER